MRPYLTTLLAGNLDKEPEIDGSNRDDPQANPVCRKSVFLAELLIQTHARYHRYQTSDRDHGNPSDSIRN
jgi:hypothetical protein